MTPVDYVIIGSRVRRRRKESGLTQEQLAEMAAIPSFMKASALEAAPSRIDGL